jgi:hypothetical protein
LLEDPKLTVDVTMYTRDYRNFGSKPPKLS